MDVLKIASLVDRVATLGSRYAQNHTEPVQAIYQIALFRLAYWQGRYFGKVGAEAGASPVGVEAILGNIEDIYALLDSIEHQYKAEGITSGYDPINLVGDPPVMGEHYPILRGTMQHIWQAILNLIPQTEYREAYNG